MKPIRERIESSNSERLRFALKWAEAASKAMRMTLELEYKENDDRVASTQFVRRTQIIKVGLSPNVGDTDFEHHIAHELAHVISGPCGFTLDVDFEDETTLDRYEEEMTTYAEDDCILLNPYLGSCIPHVAVHRILAALGYTEENWDGYLIERLKAKRPKNEIIDRVSNLVNLIQYDLIESSGYSALNTSELQEILKSYFPSIAGEFRQIKSSMAQQEWDYLKPEDCLQATNFLWQEFANIMDNRTTLNISIGFQPPKEWELGLVLVSLQRGSPPSKG